MSQKKGDLEKPNRSKIFIFQRLYFSEMELANRQSAILLSTYSTILFTKDVIVFQFSSPIDDDESMANTTSTTEKGGQTPTAQINKIKQ